MKVDWDGIIPALLEKKCDAIVASMSATEERKQVIDFSAKYYQLPNRFVARPTPGLTDTPEGMAGKVVGVQRGTIHQNFMEAHYPDTELRLYGTQDEADLDLAAGRVDALMADAVSLDEGFLKTPAGRGLRLLRRREPLRPGDPRLGRRGRRAQGGHRRFATASRRRSPRSAPTAATRRSPSSTSASTSTAADAPAGAPARRPAMDNLIRYAPILASGALVTIALAVLLAGARHAPRRARRRRAARRRAARARGGGRLHHRRARRAGPRDAAPRLLRRAAAGEHRRRPGSASAPTDLSPFLAGVLALGFIYGAYLTETFRGAYLTIPKGQLDAGRALGLHRLAVLWTIAMPQLLRFALPGYANVWQVLVKSTALVSVIGLQDVVGIANDAGKSAHEPFVFFVAVLGGLSRHHLGLDHALRPPRTPPRPRDRRCALTSSSPTGRSSPRAS